MTEIEITIQRLVPGGDGLGFHADGAVFVPFTAPGDHLRVRLTQGGRHYRRGEMVTLLSPGPERMEPLCSHYGHCGGCHLQHLQRDSRHQAKRAFVLDGLQRLGHIADADALTRPLLPAPDDTGYRQRASFKVRHIQGRLLLGFFAPGSHHLVDVARCPILHPALEALLSPLRQVLGRIARPDRLPQVDAVQGENGTAVILHHLDPLPTRDQERLRGFAQERGLLQLWLQSGRKQTLTPLVEGADPFYRLEEMALRFRPGDFTQANFAQNRRLVTQILELAGSGNKAVDLFCGIGNFTLPLGYRYAQVAGIEGYGPAVERGQNNARNNRMATLHFRQMNLHGSHRLDIPELAEADLCLINPPRTGAKTIMACLSHSPVERVIYVSCDPATFARDAAHLSHNGYRLQLVQPFDMLPLTHHVETVALFTRHA
ncbi:MAG: 23S rRNA (uracil(1939)-C(5))-methyltransferase RlmD [Magnetococcales bacterium]|nr:23S rRNA (uracil(1939)-C(5))-methyltransferase RlmD [Magnetococcales bacterium]